MHIFKTKIMETLLTFPLAIKAIYLLQDEKTIYVFNLLYI